MSSSGQGTFDIKDFVWTLFQRRSRKFPLKLLTSILIFNLLNNRSNFFLFKGTQQFDIKDFVWTLYKNKDEWDHSS